MTVRVKYAKLQSKIARVERKLNQAGRITVREMAQYGTMYAKMIAPHWSGKTASLITFKMQPRVRGARASIISKNYVHGNFDLVRWMHKSRGFLAGYQHIKSGDPTYMYTTKQRLKAMKGKFLRSGFNSINLK